MEKNKTVTLENRLREYALHDERAETLLRSYEVIKEDMKLYLPAIFAYYPHYSAHDSSHSQNLIAAIELILGESRISELSLSDIWLILVAAQLHDIGMILPNEEIMNLINKPDFKRYLEGKKEALDTDFARAATLLLEKKIQESNNTWFLDIKQSVILLIADYLRSQHAERSNVVVSGDTIISRLFSMKQSGEMSRAFNTVGNICAMHGRNFDDIFTLYETDSILHMECHPRFVAALIRLGDLCDVDNGRFNAAMMAVFGKLPQGSLVHFYKHKTITRLCISTREICMSADIPFEKIQDELVREGYGEIIQGEDFCHRIVCEHQHWFNMIKEELQNILLHAGEIYPKDMDQTLPAFKQEILVNGQRSMLANSNLRLNFAPEKAYALIEGYSLYDEQRTFVREFVQNSLDAMKIQLWRDLKDGRWNSYLSREKRKCLSALQPFDLYKEVYASYPVEIKTETNEATDSNTITFKDNGIGISYDDLQNNIIRTGTSWSSREKYEDELNEMPLWMRPTGGFGIGLHAVFAVTDRIEIKSKTRYEENPKHIIIHSGQQDGFVFARTVEEPFLYGTKIMAKIEKPISDIRSKQAELSPYDTQPADEFASFIEEYLKEIICCPLFPVFLNEKEIGEMLCTSSLYGAIFDKERRKEWNEDVALAVTDNMPMRYIVWNRKAGHFYRLLPYSSSFPYAKRSFKGIYLELCKDVSANYNKLLKLEALECLSSNSQKAISVDRKDFLTEYKRSIVSMMKNIIKPLIHFGEEQYIKLLKAPCGSLSTEDFLILCDAIAQFSVGEDISLSPKWKEKLDEFLETMAEELDTKKAIYFIYLAFAHLRFFKESIDRFLSENPDLLLSEDKVNEHLEKLMIFLQPQLQLVTNTFTYLYEHSNKEFLYMFAHSAFDGSFGGAFGHAIGRAIDHEFSSIFGVGFGRKFGDAFGNSFCAWLERKFHIKLDTFNIGFNDAFNEEYTVKFTVNLRDKLSCEFGIEFGNVFTLDFVREFGNHILTNEWEWLVWIGYYERCIPKCVNSIYFQSIPVSHFHYYVENAKTVFDIIDKSDLTVLYKNLEYMHNKFSFSAHLSVKEMSQKNNMLLCSLTIEDSTKKTIDADKDSLATYYRQFEKYQSSLFCPTSYPNLGVEYPYLTYLFNKLYFCNNLYIFLPRTVKEVALFEFITQNNQKPIVEIVDVVMQAIDTVNIIKYTYLHRQNRNVTHDEIRAEYHSFMMDFVTARLESSQDSSEL